jgi:hypothetical protein
VISELLISNYLDVAHASRHLRSVLKANAARICNLRISSRYWFAAQYFQTEIDSGWLVPKHEDITDIENVYNSWRRIQFTKDCIELHDHGKVKHFSLLGQHFPEEVRVQDEEELIHNKTSGPGPQYLLLLESGVLNIPDGGIDANGDESDVGSILRSARNAFVCAAYFCANQGHWEIWGGNPYKILRFFDELNDRHIPIKDGNLSAELAHSGAPRGLMWY